MSSDSSQETEDPPSKSFYFDDSSMDNNTLLYDFCNVILRDLKYALEKDTGWAWKDTDVAVHLHDVFMSLRHWKNSIHWLAIGALTSEVDASTSKVDEDVEPSISRLLQLVEDRDSFLSSTLRSYLEDIAERLRNIQFWHTENQRKKDPTMEQSLRKDLETAVQCLGLQLTPLRAFAESIKHTKQADPARGSLAKSKAATAKIHEDARKGILVGDRLNSYIKNNPNIINEHYPHSNLTPLAIAVVEGHSEEVDELLKKGAKAYGLSRNGATPLLLAAWKTTNERSRIIQLLLARTPSSFVDNTCDAANNKTPLMYAIEKKDIESIKMLRRAGASLTVKNSHGLDAKEVARNTNDSAVVHDVLYPEKKQSLFARLYVTIATFLLYNLLKIIVIVNNRFFHWETSRLRDPLTNEVVNHTQHVTYNLTAMEEQTIYALLEYVGTVFNDDAVLRFFFENRKDYIQDLTGKIVDLIRDPDTNLTGGDVLRKIVKVSLHQQVIYCDDSSSMRVGRRWDSQKKLVQRITKITTRILPEGEGVALRFINRDVNNSSNLTFEEIGTIMDSWQPNGDTKIGTHLKSEILEPLVYSKIEEKNLERPLLITIITDGMPSSEDPSQLVKAISECGDRLQHAGYPRESVKFIIGQIGTETSAMHFLGYVRSSKAIASVTFVTSDKLDAKFAEFDANNRELDQWLIETLFSPFKDAETETDK